MHSLYKYLYTFKSERKGQQPVAYTFTVGRDVITRPVAAAEYTYTVREVTYYKEESINKAKRNIASTQPF
jgi:hypothetical protein